MAKTYHLVLRPEFQDAQQGQGKAQQGEIAPRSRDEVTSTTQQEGSPSGPQATPGQRPDPFAGCMDNLWIFLPMIAIFYFMLIRPQQKQEKQRRAMIEGIKKGDKVVTSGGIHGVITNLNDKTITLRVDSDNKVKLVLDRANVGRVLGDPAQEKSG
jgi:preprotein translocase subunit YajC